MVVDKGEYMRAYRQAHKEKLREQCKLWYQTHKQEAKEHYKVYYQAHEKEIKERMRRTALVRKKRLQLATLLHYSNGTMACVRCGFSDVRALCLDHVNGGGTRHRKRLGGSASHVWLWLACHGFPNGYQILCANCNTIKAREEDELGGGKGGYNWGEMLKVDLNGGINGH